MTKGNKNTEELAGVELVEDNPLQLFEKKILIKNGS